MKSETDHLETECVPEAPLSCLDIAGAEGCMLIRVGGVGNMYLALTLREFFQQCAQRGYDRFFFDLGGCTGLDSTFMGTLIHLADAAKRRGGSLRIFNVTPSCARVLEMLGVNRLLDLGAKWEFPVVTATRLVSVRDDARKRLELIRVAHESLFAVSTENRERFGRFLEMLCAEMDAAPAAPETTAEEGTPGADEEAPLHDLETPEPYPPGASGPGAGKGEDPDEGLGERES